MNEEISKVVKHLIDNYYNSSTGPETKYYLIIRFYHDLKLGDGNIRSIFYNSFRCDGIYRLFIVVDATGHWMKYFNMEKFGAEVWHKHPKQMFIHIGNTKQSRYRLYKKTDEDEVTTVHRECEPYIKGCKYYVSFVFNIHEQEFINTISLTKKFIVNLASEHKKLKIKLMENDVFLNKDKEVEQYIIYRVHKEISKIVKYLIDNHYNTSSENKYLSIEIYNELKFDGGNIKIEATGDWVRDFDMRRFQGQVWHKPGYHIYKPIFVRVGNTIISNYEMYKVEFGKTTILEFENEPYVDDCEHYVSFIFQAQEQILKDKFPIIENYIKDVADEHKELKIKLMGNDEFWDENKKVEKCINVIADSISTFCAHRTSDSQGDIFQTDKELMDKLKFIISQSILNYERNKI